MRTTRAILIPALAICLGLLRPGMTAVSQQTAGELFEKALYVEEGQGDLQKAIGLYQDIVKRFPGEREVAAKAQLHIGLCYEKLGLTEAEKAYQKVVDNYPEQSDTVKEAREKLAVLSRSRALMKTAKPEFRTRQIWAGPKVDTEGDVTLDGHYLSFVDLETGDLAVRDLIAGTNRRLTHIDEQHPWTEFAMFSKWSRDGRRIAYQWYCKDDILELRVMDLKDSSVRTIFRNKTPHDWAQAFDWSPDGRHVLAAIYLDATPSQSRENRAGLISVKDGSFETIGAHHRTLISSFSLPQGFASSPDGRFIVYDAPRSDEETGNRDIFIIAMDSGTESLLVEHPGNDEVVGWTPDGRGLLFKSDRNGSPDLWYLTVSEGTAQNSPTVIKLGFVAHPMGITSRGELYFGQGGSERDIYTVEVDPHTGKLLGSAKKLGLPSQGHNMGPSYSLDGKHLAYLSAPGGRGQLIGIYSRETGRVRELNPKLSGNLFPQWIPPEGRALSVLVGDKEGHRIIYQIDLQTGEATPNGSVADSSFSFRNPPVWAMDGKRFFYTGGLRTDEKRYIYTYDLETGKSERLPGTPDDASFITISPDGKWLAFINEQGNKVLRVIPTAGGEPREVHSYEHSDHVISPAWSADGGSIYLPKLSDPKGNFWDLYRISLDGREVEKTEVGLLWIRSLSASPDGRSLAFQASGKSLGEREVWVMENFLPPAPIAKTETEIRIRKVGDTIDSYFYGSPSPDGKRMTYVDWDNFANLGVRDLATGETRLLTDNKSWETGEMCYQSVFSPDGSRIAYAWQTAEGPAQLKIIGTDGSGARILRDGKDTASQQISAWSRDGKQVLAYRYREDRTIEIFLVSADDGAAKPVKTLSGLGAVSIRLSLSPDGRYVAYSCPKPQALGNPDIFLVAADGSRETPVVSHPAEDTVVGWTPDGKRLLFKSDRTGIAGLWAVPIDEGRPQGDPQLLKSDMGDFTPLGLSRDGSLFYGLYSGWSDIYVASLDPETGKVITPPAKSILLNEGLNSAPDWSPDGETLACRTSGGLFMQSQRTGLTHELALKKTGGLNFHFLRWSPDGRRLLCVGVDEKGSYGALHVVDAQTGDSEIIAKSDNRGFLFACEWAPDGKSVYFIRRGKADRSFIRLGLATGTETELFRFPNSGRFWFALSPDGGQVALVTQGKLRTYSTAGGKPRDLADAKEATTIAWTRDGKFLLYAILRKGTKNIYDIWRIPSAGGDAQKLELGMANLMHLRVHPDGRRVAFTAADRPERAEVWVMENFLPPGKK